MPTDAQVEAALAALAELEGRRESLHALLRAAHFSLSATRRLEEERGHALGLEALPAAPGTLAPLLTVCVSGDDDDTTTANNRNNTSSSSDSHDGVKNDAGGTTGENRASNRQEESGEGNCSRPTCDAEQHASETKKTSAETTEGDEKRHPRMRLVLSEAAEAQNTEKSHAQCSNNDSLDDFPEFRVYADPLYYVSAAPSRELREVQSSFRKVVEAAVLVVEAQQKVLAQAASMS